MTLLEKAAHSVKEAARLLREKDKKSALVERFRLVKEAWDTYAELPQPLIFGKGLYYMAERACLPIEPYDLFLARFDDHVPTPEEERVVAESAKSLTKNPVTNRTATHITLDWERILEIGLPGYVALAEERLARAESDGEDRKTRTLLEGMLWAYRAYLRFAERYGEAAAQAGEEDMAAVCRVLCQGAPQTFRQALQLILFVYTFHLVYAGRFVSCITMGRVDSLLLPFYRKEIAAGTLTEEEAGAFIDDFCAKTNLHLGRGEHQLDFLDENYEHTSFERNHLYDSPGYVVLGGYSDAFDHRENELSVLWAKHIHPELKNPVHICRYTKDRPQALWEILAEKIRQNASVIVYNDETMIPAQIAGGVSPEDAVEYTLHPCNWADIHGGAIVGRVAQNASLPLIVNRALNEGALPESIDELYDKIEAVYTEYIDECFIPYRERFCTGSLPPCGSFLSADDCFLRGCLEKGRSLHFGGVKYPAVYVYMTILGSATDMICAVEDVVFRKRLCTLEELLAATAANFEGYDELRKACLSSPKYGTEDPVADGHAKRLLTRLLDTVDRRATGKDGKREVITLIANIYDQGHIYHGRKTPATVDGRLANTNFSADLNPTVGFGKGLMPLLHSVTSLPWNRINCGVLNVRLDRSMLRTPRDSAALLALMDGYFADGGMNLQFGITSTEELRKAQCDPEAYRDLLVRITGYSAVFVDVSRGGQEEYIRRMESTL